jgi:hypothetical protein
VTATESILAAVATLLATVPDATFYRSRESAVSRTEGITINLLPKEEKSEKRTGMLELCNFTFQVQVIARDVVPDQAADPIIQACHKKLMSDPTLGGRCSQLIREERQWSFAEADINGVLASVQYIARYQVRIDDMSLVQ